MGSLKRFPLFIIGLLCLFLSNCSTEPTPTYTFSATSTPSEGGSVSPTSGVYDEGTSVTVSATANDSYEFLNWSGGISSNQNPLAVTMDSDKSLTAVFEKLEYPFTVEIEGNGSVTKTIIPQKTTDYAYGTLLQIEAIPDDKWVFDRWIGEVDDENNPTTVTIDKEKTITAVFERQVFEVNISTEGSGSVSTQLISGSKQGSGYEYESEIELVAFPSEGSLFIEWKGDIQSSDNPLTFLINEETSLIAVFEEFPDSPFSGGNGSQMHPYEVETLDQLQEIRSYSDKHFMQIANIDASETMNWNGGDGFKPLGDQIIPFSGSYNGQDYSIDELYINRDGDSDIGLFGIIEDSVIENLILNDFYISANTYTGGITGRSNSSIIRNSHVEGEIENGSFYTGGITGSNDTNSLIENSSANIQLSATGQLGGLAGGNFGIIKNSYSTGEVESRFDITGGLVGLNFGDIKMSYSSVRVTDGRDYLGGLVGKNDSDGRIENSYATGSVTGDVAVGGLVGLNDDRGEIFTSYAVGKITGNEDVGGLIGLNGASIESSFWDSQTTNQSDGVGRGNSDGAVGLTASEMKGGDAKNNMSVFDWSTIWKTTNDYPILRWQD